MGEKERTLARKLRTLRRRTARWFMPPVRPADEYEPSDDPGERALRATPRPGAAPSHRR